MSKRLLSTLLLTILLAGGIWWQIGRSPKKPTPSPAEQLAQRIGQALDHPDIFPVPKDFERLRALLRQDPENDHLRLAQARINWMAGDLDDRISAKNKLIELARGSGPISLKALKAIAFSPLREGVFKEDLEDAAGKLRKHPLAKPTEILRVTEILLHLAKPAERDSILESVIHKLQHKDKPLLARWLIGHGFAQNTLKLVGGPEAATSSQLFFPRFQALILTDATVDAQKLLNQAEGILPPGAKAKAKAYLGKARGEPSAIANYLKWAKQNNAPKQIVEAGRFALLSGDGDAAREAYANILTTAPQALGPDECGQLLQLALNARDTPLALRTARVLHSRNPNRWGIRNNLTWLALLSGQNPIPLEKEAHRIVDAVPDNPNFLSTLALAKLLAEKPDEAIRAMRDRRGARLLPGEKALLAAALFAQGKDEEARKWTKDLSAIRMLPEEWALLQRFGGNR